MTPRQRLKIIQRLSEIERNRLEFRKSKLSYRDLTDDEKAEVNSLQEKLDSELAVLRKRLEPQFTDRQLDLFSRVVESCGGNVSMQIPTNRAAIAADRIGAL